MLGWRETRWNWNLSYILATPEMCTWERDQSGPLGPLEALSLRKAS